MTNEERLVYRLLVAVDIEGYSRRDALDQLQVQRDLSEALDDAAERAGVERDRWVQQVHGDGELAVLPDGEVVPIIGDFTRELARSLHELNGGRPPAGPRLRVRVAIHYGTLSDGPFGPAGDAPIVVSRLLDANPLRRFLRQRQDLDMAFVVSESLYRDVVQTRFCALRPADFTVMRTTTKGVAYRGYIYNPPAGSPYMRAASGAALATKTT